MPTAWDSVPVRREAPVPVIEEVESSLENEEAQAQIISKNTYERVPKSSLFGLVLGGTCGAAYGVMESFGTVEGRKPEMLRHSLLNIRLNSMIFAGTFAVFQAAKETTRVFRGTKQTDEFDPYNALAAAAVTVGPMMFHPVTRKVFPHVLFLIAVDAANESGFKMY